MTDSVLMDLSEKLCALCRQQEGFRFLPMLYCDPFHWQGDGAKTRSHIRCFIRTQMTRFQERLLRRPQPYRHARMLYALPTYQAYHRAVSGLRGFVAARFHAFCMAMHSATPVLVIPSVTSKSESLLRDIGLNPDRIIGLDNLESAVARDFSYTADERERIDAYFAKVSTRFDEMFRTIRELAR